MFSAQYPHPSISLRPSAGPTDPPLSRNLRDSGFPALTPSVQPVSGPAFQSVPFPSQSFLPERFRGPVAPSAVGPYRPRSPAGGVWNEVNMAQGAAFGKAFIPALWKWPDCAGKQDRAGATRIEGCSRWRSGRSVRDQPEYGQQEGDEEKREKQSAGAQPSWPALGPLAGDDLPLDGWGGMILRLRSAGLHGLSLLTKCVARS